MTRCPQCGAEWIGTPTDDGRRKCRDCGTVWRSRYAIVRHYFDRWPNRRTLARGLTLAEAQAHCSDPETSSSTATSATGRARTRRLGPWFDGYTEERGR